MSTTSTTTSQITHEEHDPIPLEPVSHLKSSLMRIASATDPAPIVIEASPSQETLQPPAPTSSLSRWKRAVLIVTVTSVTMINTMLAGILVVGLPTMARDLGLSTELLLWPASVNALACGCTLLVAGSIADVVGGRKVYLVGTFAIAATTVACGLARTGLQLILFRAATGVAVSLCIPSAVILITSNIHTGTARNIAFACLGAGQPIGFSIGLVMGGVFAVGIGWRWGFYLGAIVTSVLLVVCFIWIPADPVTSTQTLRTTIKRLRTEIDWLGCFFISTSLGMYSYVCAVLASGVSHFLAPATLVLFSVATILIPVFIFYTRRQERLQRKVIIPPSLWKNRVFTSLCLSVFLVWGIFNAVQFFLTLFFQEIQQLTAFQTSLRFLPMVVTGISTNVVVGWLVKSVRADVLVGVSNLITTITPLLLALINPAWSYWVCAFIATACAPICADTLFTVSNLLITTIFPPQTHGLAGGVFNTISNIGNSVGLAVTAVIASSVTIAKSKSSGILGDDDKNKLMDGYRATFWFCFGANILLLAIIGYGMRKIGKVGVKID